ncbi:MAG: N-acetyltransferase [Flavobacteriia bacterium]|jgi:RimJ/RimL family protein N-acetyltransferase|nr:N-acetyltransferase [Flavobacteriia bacterium]
MLNFKENYTLENEMVKLRPLELNDFENLLHFSINEPELWMYSLIQANSEINLKKYIELAINGRENSKEYAFIVFDKRAEKFAGSTRFYDIQIENLTLQLGYTWYGKDFQGTGLNKNCKYLLLEFAFEILKMERVEFRADYENKRSISAMKSIGCKEEGVLRSNGFKADGTRRDSIVLSILKEEWNYKIKNELKKYASH